MHVREPRDAQYYGRWGTLSVRALPFEEEGLSSVGSRGPLRSLGHNLLAPLVLDGIAAVLAARRHLGEEALRVLVVEGNREDDAGTQGSEDGLQLVLSALLRLLGGLVRRLPLRSSLGVGLRSNIGGVGREWACCQRCGTERKLRDLGERRTTRTAHDGGAAVRDQSGRREQEREHFREIKVRF